MRRCSGKAKVNILSGQFKKAVLNDACTKLKGTSIIQTSCGSSHA